MNQKTSLNMNRILSGLDLPPGAVSPAVNDFAQLQSAERKSASGTLQSGLESSPRCSGRSPPRVLGIAQACAAHAMLQHDNRPAPHLAHECAKQVMEPKVKDLFI